MQTLVVVVSLMVIHLSHLRLKDSLIEPRLPNEGSLIPSAQAVRLVSLGYEQLLADFYWLQFVSYVGDVTQRKMDRYALAVKYLDLITELDPHFTQAYWFAAIVVGGDAANPKRAAEIIDRGIEANPDNWYLPFIAGVNQYLFANDQVAAAKYYRMASKFPHAPNWLERQADILETEAPRLVKEAHIWSNIYDSAQDKRVKDRARDKAIWLWVQVFKSAPNETFRDKARTALRRLSVDIDSITRQSK